MRAGDLARGAGRAGRNGDPGKIERHHQRRRGDAGRSEAERVGQARRRGAEDRRVRRAVEHGRGKARRARLRAARSRRNARRPRRAPPRRSRRSPRHSRCPRAPPRSWPPPRSSGAAMEISPRAATSAPAPFGPPNLWAERKGRSAPNAAGERSTRPAICTASQTTRPPWRGRAPPPRRPAAARRSRCWRPAGPASPGPPAASTSAASAARSIRPSAPRGAIDRRFGREAMALQHAGMLARADDQPRAARVRRLIAGVKREIGRLGAARGEEYAARRDADERGDRAPRLFDDRARAAPFGVDGRGIAEMVDRGDRRRARFGPQRRGRVVIEIGARSIGKTPCLIQIRKCWARKTAKDRLPAPPECVLSLHLAGRAVL